MDQHLREFRLFLNTTTDLFIPIVCVFLVTLVLGVAGANATSYGKSIDYKEKLLHTTAGPRIIFIGGSGVAAGIDSAAIHRALPSYTPVNMGIYAGLGMRFITNEIRSEIRTDDIIILAPEYELLQQPSYGDGFLLLEMIQASPHTLPRLLTPHGVIVIIRAFPIWLQSQLIASFHKIEYAFVSHTASLAEKLYTIDNITKYGDLDTSAGGTVHLTSAEIDAQGLFVRDHVDATNLAIIKNLIQTSTSRGAHMYVVLPAVPQSLEAQNRDGIQRQYAELKETIGDDHIIGTPGNFTYPDEVFLDSIGHLTTAGKEVRTAEIISKLLPHLNDTSSPSL